MSDPFLFACTDTVCFCICPTKKEDSLKRILSKYSEPGSNRYGHYCPQDFKSGVSTYSTIRATWSFEKMSQIYDF